MNRYPNVCLQSLCRLGSLGPSKTTLKELKQRRFVSFQTIPCSYDYGEIKLNNIVYAYITALASNSSSIGCFPREMIVAKLHTYKVVMPQ